MRTQEQAIAMGRGHLAYYQVMAKRGQIKPVRSIQDLNEAVEAWKTPAVDTPIYHVLSMESADPIIDPDDVEFWWDAGASGGGTRPTSVTTPTSTAPIPWAA